MKTETSGGLSTFTSTGRTSAPWTAKRPSSRTATKSLSSPLLPGGSDPFSLPWPAGTGRGHEGGRTPVRPGAPPRRLWIERPVLDAMFAASLQAAPAEACGLLGGRDGVATSHYPVPNVAPEPTERFVMDPAGQSPPARVPRSRPDRGGGGGPLARRPPPLSAK